MTNDGSISIQENSARCFVTLHMVGLSDFSARLKRTPVSALCCESHGHDEHAHDKISMHLNVLVGALSSVSLSLFLSHIHLHLKGCSFG